MADSKRCDHLRIDDYRETPKADSDGIYHDSEHCADCGQWLTHLTKNRPSHVRMTMLREEAPLAVPPVVVDERALELLLDRAVSAGINDDISFVPAEEARKFLAALRPASLPVASESFKAHVTRVIGDAMTEIGLLRDSSQGSMFEQFAAYAVRLRALIGDAPEGSHPDEWLPRHATWHGERANWQGEVERLRSALPVASGDVETTGEDDLCEDDLCEDCLERRATEFFETVPNQLCKDCVIRRLELVCQYAERVVVAARRVVILADHEIGRIELESAGLHDPITVSYFTEGYAEGGEHKKLVPKTCIGHTTIGELLDLRHALRSYEEMNDHLPSNSQTAMQIDKGGSDVQA